MSNIIQEKENREMELLLCFYKNMGSDKTIGFTFGHFINTVSGKIDLTPRMLGHYFDKLIENSSIIITTLYLNDQELLKLNTIVTDLLKELNI